MAGWRKRFRAYDARREAFVAALASGASVAAACRRAGLDRDGAYRARARDPGFAARWDAALGHRGASWRRAFLTALEASGKVEAACRLSGRGVSGIYKARRREPALARAWADALARARAAEEAEAERRIARRRQELEPAGCRPLAVSALSDRMLAHRLRRRWR